MDQEVVSELTDQDVADFETMRDWLRGHFKEGAANQYDTLAGKLSVIDAIVRNGWFDRNNLNELQALGLGLGDAIAQQIGLQWAIVTDRHGDRIPILILPRTSLQLSAFTMIQKRIAQNEEVEVFPLFEALCQQIESIRAPKRSLLGRLFGPRLT